MNQLFRFIEKYTGLSKNARETLQELVCQEEYKKNEYLLSAGDYCKKVWFLKSGMVRKYFLDNGKEITTWIHTEDQMFTSLNSYFRGLPSDEFFVASENTALLSISLENSKKLEQFPEMVKFSKIHLETEISAIDCISKRFNLLSARKKYELLSREAPEIIKRAQLGHIASIMGVTQETLSRIRKS